MIKLSDDLRVLKGVGPKFYERLKKFGKETIKDLLWHFPSRHEDFSQISKISDLKIGEPATVQGVIQEIKVRRTWRRRLFIVEAFLNDGTGTVRAIWFNQRFLLTIFKKGTIVSLAGKISEDPKTGIFMSHPIYELANNWGDLSIENDTKHTGRLVPIYPETRGITSKALRFLIKPALDGLEKIKDPIPIEILKERNFPEINRALRDVHFPEETKEARIAKKRFAFEDLFFLQLNNIEQRLRLAKEKAYSFPADFEYIRNLLSGLPFELTQSQKKSLLEILKDLERSYPMNRLLQGDVGSGKTIVAAVVGMVIARGGKPFDAASASVKTSADRQGRQSAFMAPTEVLARQHYNTFQEFFKNFDKGVGLLTSAESRIFYGDGLEGEIAKLELVKKISKGEVKIIIGTHALIQKNIKFKDLSFVVIDEQHRFGVRQRAELTDQSPDYLPHFLSMSATPIPRTLSLTLFGDLDLSIIDELPKGRKQIITKIVAPANRDKAYAFIRGQVKKGRQVFVICPRIEPTTDNEQQTTNENVILTPRQKSLLEIKSVKEEYEKLSQKVFPDLRVAMLHGKMKAKDKGRIMDDFSAKGACLPDRQGSASGGKDKKIDGSASLTIDPEQGRRIDILVSTSVIEVGVDIPNATIMMIEGSDRFGLAQLYQFRGRVGRGEHQSFCFLFTDSPAKSVYKRLNSLLEAKNGFELAEKDLEIRGPGEFLGESQTGLPDLAMKAVQNPELVKSSREAAELIIKNDPELKKYPLIKEYMEVFAKEVHLE